MKLKLLSKLLSLAGLFTCVSANAQAPVAGFSINSNTICAKESVQVTDISTNAPTAWSYSINGVFASNSQAPELFFPTAGTYSIDLEATNGSGTSAIHTETLLVQALPIITVSGNTLICTSAASTLSANGADTYSWSSGQFVSTVTITPALNSTYTLVGSSTLTGCSDTSFVAVATLPLPTITVSNGTICAGQSFTINPSGASTYTIQGGQTVVSPTINTTYMVSGTDTNTGCSDSVSLQLSVNVLSLTASSGSVCSGQSFTIVPSGAVSYTYSSGSNVVTPTTTTNYTVTGAAANDGCSDTVIVTVSITQSPTITVNSGSLCAGSVFNIQPAGAASYTYSSGSSTIAPATNTTVVVGGTDPLTGCPGFATVTINVVSLPVISVASGSICGGDSYVLSPQGAFSYTFSSGSPTVSPLVTTSYTVTGASAEGCKAQNTLVATVVVAGVKPTVSITPLQSNLVCLGQTIVLNAIGAGTYSWSTGATSSTAAITPTVTALYGVTGTDSFNGCSDYASILLYVSDCTSIEKASSDIQFNLYPNPTNGDLIVDAEKDMILSIVNTIGQIVYNQNLTAGKNTISLNDQPQGIYFVTLKQNNTTKTVRIIKH
ncbi:hypothetical protein CNR22_03290 [Sphingobacteriaceae bacterium]|nr:hypothetical protein CNR22_03290 [Sphingobacteriaceae bacterium]